MTSFVKNQNAIINGNVISNSTAKTTPVDADSVGISDSADSGILKKLTWANLKATLASVFVTSDTASLKCKVVTGTTAASDTYVDVNHSISGTIVSAFCVVDNGSGAYLCHGYTASANLEFNFFVDSTKVRVVNKASNSTDIRSKTFKCVIFYT